MEELLDRQPNRGGTRLHVPTVEGKRGMVAMGHAINMRDARREIKARYPKYTGRAVLYSIVQSYRLDTDRTGKHALPRRTIGVGVAGAIFVREAATTAPPGDSIAVMD